MPDNTIYITDIITIKMPTIILNILHLLPSLHIHQIHTQLLFLPSLKSSFHQVAGVECSSKSLGGPKLVCHFLLPGNNNNYNSNSVSYSNNNNCIECNCSFTSALWKQRSLCLFLSRSLPLSLTHTHMLLAIALKRRKGSLTPLFYAVLSLSYSLYRSPSISLSLSLFLSGIVQTL